MAFWILSLALRSLGLTTVAVGSAAMVGDLRLRDIRCVVAVAGEEWPDLAPLCQARGLKLLSVALDDDPSPDAAIDRSPHEPGGHILLTSGTTGVYKMVLSTRPSTPCSCAGEPRSAA